MNVNHGQHYANFYNALKRGKWEEAKEFLEAHPEAVRAKISFDGGTALHNAALFGHLHIVKELVELMSEQDLELQDDFGRTALYIACQIGIFEIAECMVRKNKNLLTIPHRNEDAIPVTHAISLGKKELAVYLYSVTPLEELLPVKGHQGATLLSQSIPFESLDVGFMAKDLLERCPQLAITPNCFGATFVMVLANYSSAFQSGCNLSFWKKWIYNWILIEPASLTRDIRIIVRETNTTKNNAYNISIIPGINEIYKKKKLAHELSLGLLRITFNEIAILSSSEEQIAKVLVYNAMFSAAKHGIPEFIIEAARLYPDLLLLGNENDRTVFFYAIEFRQAGVFNLIYGPWTDMHTTSQDKRRNNLLHVAGILAPTKQLSRISGAALQMQRELQWFKEVERLMKHSRRESTNRDGMTPRELFTINHKDLVKEGERWMKETASSSTVVAALIVTMMFAAAFTVPGGNDETGYPMFLNQKLFKLFIISDAVSLFSSTTSVLMFLGILTSRYAEDDFLKSLPTKLIIGLSMLFISIAAMMIAFCAVLSVMLPGRQWIVIPVILFASVPVSLFVWLQFPLLVEIFISTYGASIFERNTERWL